VIVRRRLPRLLCPQALVAVAVVACVAAWTSRAGAAPPCPAGTGAPYADHDGNGVPDACDACPASPPGGPTTSRDPACYLAPSWVVPPAYAFTSTTRGAWWTAGACWPAMAFAVRDRPSRRNPQGATTHGFVVVGAASADAAAAIRASAAPWPASVPAACLLSFDYTSPARLFALRAPALAYLYARWNVAGLADPDYSPDDGLGLVERWPPDSLTERAPLLSARAEALQRLPLSRGVLFGGDLGATGGETCAERGAGTDDPYFDPTADSALFAPPGACTKIDPTVTDPLAAPLDWRVAPHALDDVLLTQRELVRALLTGGPRAGNAGPIEGVPIGLLADDRTAAIDGASPLYLPTGAALFPPSSPAGDWLVVPEAIGLLGQHLHYVAVTSHGRADLTPAAYRPSGAADYSPHVTNGKLLVVQAFPLPREQQGTIVNDAERRVETEWPDWPPAAATSEVNQLYGARWTTNGASRDCWASPLYGAATDEIQQLAYPASSASSATAAQWCPSALASWHNGNAPARSRRGANSTCAPATIFQSSVIGTSTILGAVTSCLHDDATNQNAGCCSSICDLGDEVGAVHCWSSPCCVALAENFAKLDDRTAHCIADAVVGALAGFDPLEHWKDVGDGRDLVPMVDLFRFAGRTVGIESFLSNQDLFLGGVHQGSDWNWDAERPEMIDPAYRTIAMRDGFFEGIENELEFLIPLGRWDAKREDAHDADFHGHNLADLLESDGLGALGQVWPTTPPFHRLFGMTRDLETQDPNSFPKRATEDGITYEAFWRTHFGRGIFAPPELPLTSTEAGRMAIDPRWPDTPVTPSSIPIDLEDWLNVPHRLAFLGRPIVDCGHEPFRVEIHPPHVVTVDVARGVRQAAQGVIVAAFGWMNVAGPGHLEFDLWPPPRPSAAAQLVVEGNKAATGAGFVPDVGYLVEPGLQHAPSEAAPAVTCAVAPADHPNHVHCAYDDASASTSPPASVDEHGWRTPPKPDSSTKPVGNRRMTPYYATSRFDLRMFLGWKEAP
jgi:hypothetical protein